jgi:CHAT domain-containing protein
VFVVPDGAIALVALASLPQGANSFLLESAPPIHYLSAERDLAARAVGVASRGRGLLALGGPTFDAGLPVPRAAGSGASAPQLAALRSADSCRSFQALHFEALDGTRQEVDDVAGLWRAASAAASEETSVLQGDQATEQAFKQRAAHHRVLHLATHGFFLGSSCTASRPGTRGVGAISSPLRVAPAENPLLLSGLAFAGANRRSVAGPNEDDGILTAEEVASLDLSGVEWAVLSACDTGVGEIRAGEGVFGLRRAFQIAGARTVVMSLWSVDDQATRAWMKALYEGRFQRQLTTADAVHEASLTVLRDRRARGLSTHPFFWAAFVAAGDWR